MKFTHVTQIKIIEEDSEASTDVILETWFKEIESEITKPWNSTLDKRIFEMMQFDTIKAKCSWQFYNDNIHKIIYKIQLMLLEAGWSSSYQGRFITYLYVRSPKIKLKNNWWNRFCIRAGIFMYS